MGKTLTAPTVSDNDKEVPIPALRDKAAQLLLDKNHAVVGTLRRDGSAQLTTVWIDYDGENVLFNTAEGRAKPRNIRRDPRVSVLVIDRNDPYAWVSVTGRAEMTREGADEHIDKLSEKYTGRTPYAGRKPGEQRLLVRVRPDRVVEYLRG